ncbi:hypothetical protein DOY81_004565 [Sarcophaga bullata]|nr:hypothetical protein DOY81_004565 [Sarcophaga bullata]
MKLILVCGILAAFFVVNKAKDYDEGESEIFEPFESSGTVEPCEVQYEVHSAFCDKVQQSIDSYKCVKSWLVFWSQLCVFECNAQGDVKIKKCCDDANGEAHRYAMCSDLQCVKSTVQSTK